MCKDNADDPICLHAADTCHKRLGETEVNWDLLFQVPESQSPSELPCSWNRRRRSIEEVWCNSAEVKIKTDWKDLYFLSSFEWSLSKYTHIFSSFKATRSDCDRSEHDYTTMNVSDIKFLLRVQKAETIDFNDTSPKCYDPPPTVCPQLSVISQSEDFNQAAWPIRGQ